MTDEFQNLSAMYDAFSRYQINVAALFCAGLTVDS